MKHDPRRLLWRPPKPRAAALPRLGPSLGEVLLLLVVVERLGAVGDSHEELGLLDVLAVLVVDHGGVDGKAARIDLDPADVAAVDPVELAVGRWWRRPVPSRR